MKGTAVKASDAWISPEGHFYAVSWGGHSTFASEHLGDATGGANLENEGWAHISGGSILMMKPCTQDQLNTLFDLLTEYRKVEWPYLSGFERDFHRRVERDQREGCN